MIVDGFCSYMIILLLLSSHCCCCWSCLRIRIRLNSENLNRSISCSVTSLLLSVFTCWRWYITNRSRFPSSRFSRSSWFTWFLKLSMWLCLRILDRLADSRFDSILFLFLSSVISGWISLFRLCFFSPGSKFARAVHCFGSSGSGLSPWVHSRPCELTVSSKPGLMKPAQDSSEPVLISSKPELVLTRPESDSP